MDLVTELLQAEDRVWRALQAGDVAADAALLAPDFLGLYPSGYAGRADHAGQLAAGPTVASYAITQARALPLAEGLALLTYLASYHRPGGGQAEQMWVSSLWRREAAGWINLFSQDTPCNAPFAPV